MAKGKLIWHISSDFLPASSASYSVYSALWMKYQRRGDFSKQLKNLKEQHQFDGVINYTDTFVESNKAFYQALISWVINANWLAIHHLVVSFDTKSSASHVINLLQNKQKQVKFENTDRDCEFRFDVANADALNQSVLLARPTTKAVLSNQNTELQQIASVFAYLIADAYEGNNNYLIETLSQDLGWSSIKQQTWFNQFEFNLQYQGEEPVEVAE